MKGTIKYLSILCFAVLFSCTKEKGKINRGEYPDEIGKIISSSCSVQGCHNSASYLAAAGLNLDSWSSMFLGSSSGSPVIPFSSRFSSLCYFINTFSELGSQNVPTMPLNKPPLAIEQVKSIYDWINKGAPDRTGNIMWADDVNRKKLYAVNQGCDVVTVLDANSQLPMRYIEVGEGGRTPHHVRVSPDGKYWYVIFINDNIMKKYRCSDDRFIGSIPLTPMAAGTGTINAQDWNTFVITKDGKRAYCVSWTQSGKIAKVDLENMKFLGILSALYYPHGIALNDDEDKLYVAAQTGNFITEIDTGFSTSTDHLLDGSSINYLSSIDPHDMILTADKNSLAITCSKSNDMRIFNLKSNIVTTVIKTGYYPQEIVFSDLFKSYYVTCTGNGSSSDRGSVSIINSISFDARNIKIGAQPHGLAVEESKKVLYVLSRNIDSNGPPPHHSSQCEGRNGFLNFIDLRTLEISKKNIELSVDPYFIFLRP